MKVALFAEGRSDIAIITNILKGWLNIDKCDISYEVPEFDYDETDLAQMKKEKFSNWSIVKESCINKQRMSTFFNSFEDSRFGVVQIDTEERFSTDYDVIEPAKNRDDIGNYCNQLRNNVIAKINGWLNNEFTDKLAYAICIEEIDAWLMTIYKDRNEDTSIHNDPKDKLNNLLNKKITGKDRKILKLTDTFEKYTILSNSFRRKKNLIDFFSNNISLQLFCESLDKFVAN